MSGALICGALLQLFSLHQVQGLHTFTPGIGVECQSEGIVAAAGTFQNSQGLTSAYAAAGGLADLGAGFRAGAVAGVVNGYRYRDGGAIPLVAGVVSVDLGSAQIQAFITPHYGPSHAALQVGVFIPLGAL